MTEQGRKTITVAIAETLEGDVFHKAIEALGQYAHQHDRLRGSGIRLSDYMASALLDISEAIPEDLRKKLDAEQHRFGPITEGLNLTL